jgi:hypothetical protein
MRHKTSDEMPPARLRNWRWPKWHRSVRMGSFTLTACESLPTDQPNLLMSAQACRSNSRSCRCSSNRSRVKRPCLSAFLLPRGAPDPNAPPCIRQRRFLLTAGDIQGLPERVLAPQRGLHSMGSYYANDRHSLICLPSATRLLRLRVGSPTRFAFRPGHVAHDRLGIVAD